MPPAPTFVKLCAEAGVTLPTVKAERIAFLVNSGVIFSDTINVRELAELVATLAWAQHSLARNDDPDSWPTTLPESLLGRLISLYPIPPRRPSPGSPALDASRMATAIALYAPSDAAPGLPQPPNNSAGPPAPLPLIKPPGKRMMHEELSRALPPVVYHASDVSSHLTADKRSKLLAACKSHDPSVLLDGTNSRFRSSLLPRPHGRRPLRRRTARPRPRCSRALRLPLCGCGRLLHRRLPPRLPTPGVPRAVEAYRSCPSPAH